MDDFLRSKRLYLRRLMASDAGNLFRYRSDPDVSRYQGWAPASESEALRFIEDQSNIEPGGRGAMVSARYLPAQGRQPDR